MKNQCENEAVILYLSKSVFIEKRLFRKRRMYGNHMFHRVEYVSARVPPKNENQENEKQLQNFTFGNRYRKRDGLIMKKPSKNNPKLI